MDYKLVFETCVLSNPDVLPAINTEEIIKSVLNSEHNADLTPYQAYLLGVSIDKALKSN